MAEAATPRAARLHPDHLAEADDRRDLRLRAGWWPGARPLVRPADRHRYGQARLPRAPLGRPPDRRWHPEASPHSRHGPRPGHDHHGPYRRGRGGARNGTAHRDRRAGQTPRPRSGDGRGPRPIPAGDDAGRPALGTRGLLDCPSRRASPARRRSAARSAVSASRAPPASPPARAAAAKEPGSRAGTKARAASPSRRRPRRPPRRVPPAVCRAASWRAGRRPGRCPPSCSSRSRS